MGYAQYPKQDRGKFYANGDKDQEIPATDFDDVSVQPGSRFSISTCGRNNSPAGTEGTIDVLHDGTKVCTLYWNTPWVGSNDFQVQNTNSDAGYLVGVGPWNREGGALGDVEIKVAKEE
ncbi:aegerolysin type hemolysin [Hygrophoropsis aurantiaca]|uniref:Aegerolysin type hemolysin n=1 Tax=Hygrophoropsis aurantiaca TaxID=72124 RepID=A0ACB8A9U1_9AGAM|nr:aegerolysin type hemolysin [Hygrophoropsis aurantiaca]